MKYTKTCPKCLSENIVRFDGFLSSSSLSNAICVSQSWIPSLENIVNIHRYVCCNCGFTEEWIDKEDLPRVTASKFAKR